MKNSNKIIVGCVLVAFLLFIGMVGSGISSGISLQANQVEIEDYVYGTYFGGTDEDQIRDVAIDSQGDIVVIGSTYTINFPVLNAFQDSYGGNGEIDDHHLRWYGGDGIVAKFNATGQLLWSTYLGGDRNDCARHVVIDASDNIIVIGNTNSTDFPVTDDAYQSTYVGGFIDIFITKFAPNGSLIYSSYFGGTDYEEPGDLTLDSSGNLVITGGTGSIDFPLTADAVDNTITGDNEAFFTILGPDFSLVYSTFFGGSEHEGGDDIAIDGQGNIIVTGYTMSQDFPITDDAYQDTINGTERDFFIAKFSSDYQLTYATYFGGSHMDDCFGLAVDSAGNIILTGRTWSIDYPTANAYQDNIGAITEDGVDGFITKLSADGQELVYSTYLGDVGWDTVLNPVVDSSDNVIFTLVSETDDFPVIDAFQPNHGGGLDILIMMMSPAGTPLFSSYLGGTSIEFPNAQVFSGGSIYIVGVTESTNFLTTDDAHQQVYMGNTDGFIFRLELSDYLDDINNEESSTTTQTTQITQTTQTSSVSGFELPFVILALTSSISFLTRVRKKL
ncbi:MAG: SBBP repeat-containing protein [Candidatus Hodarchaeales archaeon]|jgi:hypothetical protein